MIIKYAILGLLSRKPQTGYELKKIIMDSPVLCGSGSDNQIYTALVELLKEGLVESRVSSQSKQNTKKIYSITDSGLSALKEWAASTPEAPQIKNSFLIQLTWAHLLDDNQLNDLLGSYEDEVKVQFLMQQEKFRRENMSPNQTQREILLCDAIRENVISSCMQELRWIEELKEMFTKGRVFS